MPSLGKYLKLSKNLSSMTQRPFCFIFLTGTKGSCDSMIDYIPKSNLKESQYFNHEAPELRKVSSNPTKHRITSVLFRNSVH